MLGTARRRFPSVAGLSALLEQLRGLTSQPFGVNFIIKDNAPIERACFEMAAGYARVVDLFLWTLPDIGLIDLIHRGGARAPCQVGSREEAVAAADSALCPLGSPSLSLPQCAYFHTSAGRPTTDDRYRELAQSLHPVDQTGANFVYSGGWPAAVPRPHAATGAGAPGMLRSIGKCKSLDGAC